MKRLPFLSGLVLIFLLSFCIRVFADSVALQTLYPLQTTSSSVYANETNQSSVTDSVYNNVYDNGESAVVNAVYANSVVSGSVYGNLVVNFIDDYFKLRQDSFYISSNLISRSDKQSSIENLATSNILSDENSRISKLTAMDTRLHMEIVAARTTPYIRSIKTEGSLIKAYVYEWTFFDHKGKRGLVDTSGYGVNHELVFQYVRGTLKLIADNYDEGPLTAMTSSTYNNPSVAESVYENNESTVTSSVYGDSVNTVTGSVYSDVYNVNTNKFANNLSIKTISNESDSQNLKYTAFEAASSYSNYSVSGVEQYADNYVYHGANGAEENWDGSYNSAYVDMNNGYGGDCTNYVSQCMYQGGNLPMVDCYTENGSGSWWYNFNGPGWLSSWANASANFSFMANNYGTAVYNPSSSQIFPGNPIYYNGNVHAAICVGYDSNGTPIIDQHNWDYYHLPWNYWTTTYNTVQVVNGNTPPPAPTVNLTSPASGSYCVLGYSITITASGTNCDHMAVYAMGPNDSGYVYQSNSLTYGNNLSYTFTPGYTGTWWFYVAGRNTRNSTDPGSILVNSNAIAVYVISSPPTPTVALTSPSNGSNYTLNQTIYVTGTGTNCDHMAATYTINGNTTWLPWQNGSGNSYSQSFTPQLAGTYSITLYGNNMPSGTLGGQSATPATVTVYVNNSTPAYASNMISNTIPATMTAGQSYNVSVTVENTGTNTWTAAGAYRLGAGGDVSGQAQVDFGCPNRVCLTSTDSIATGQSKTFSFTMTAPTTAGNYSPSWEMVQDGVCWFGQTLTVPITVNA